MNEVDPAIAKIGDNSGATARLAPDDVEKSIAALYADTLAIADRLIARLGKLPPEIKTDEEESKATSFIVSQVLPVIDDLRRIHGEEKQPFFEAGKRVDTIFLRRVDSLKALRAAVSGLTTRWKLKKEEAAKKAAADEAAKAAKLAAEMQTSAAQQYAEQTQRAAETAPKEATKATGLHGGTSGLSRVWRFRVKDIAKVPRQYLMINEDAVKATMKAAGKDGMPTLVVDGIEFFTEASTKFRG